MAKNRRTRGQTVRLTRPNSALGHTVSRFRASEPEPDYSPVPTGPVRYPLIRTVLVDTSTHQNPPRRGNRQSPGRQVRATFRSSDRQTRSPFLNATMLTPELTNRAIVCAGRNIRREVLFARKQTGKGSRSPRRNRSKVKC